MNKFIRFISYYILLSLGLIAISWIIWSRFIRERTIRDIPDDLLTEYRVWILIYICCIYMYIIKNLVKPRKITAFTQIITISLEYLFKPLITLDHAIKYNRFIKDKYHKMMLIIIYTIHTLKPIYLQIIIICFTTNPYWVIPFIFRYLRYSIKDIYNHWIEELESIYSSVIIFKEGLRI